VRAPPASSSSVPGAARETDHAGHRPNVRANEYRRFRYQHTHAASDRSSSGDVALTEGTNIHFANPSRNGVAGELPDRRPYPSHQQQLKFLLRRRIKFQLPMPLTDRQRVVLQILATSPRGYSLAAMGARGFAFEVLQDLVGAGLAVVQRDAVAVGKTKLPHLRITAAVEWQSRNSPRSREVARAKIIRRC
jgi:hypothetical protein